MQTGAVTLLDILGWKGIWLTRCPIDKETDTGSKFNSEAII